ncbi:MAG TPA: hypothetical protein VK066_20020 [Chloroflexota bacterium]|nr:hypothetical protein [Chloroflexota bacterium]
MPYLLLRRYYGRGLVVLGASVQGWHGRVPTCDALATLLRLRYEAILARRVGSPRERLAAARALERYRRQLDLVPESPPVPWAEADWVVVMAEPTTPVLRVQLRRYAPLAKLVSAASATEEAHAAPT